MQKHRVQLQYFTAGEFRSRSLCLGRVPSRGDGEEMRAAAVQRAGGAPSRPRYLPMREGASQIGHSLKVYIAEFRKPPLSRTTVRGGRGKGKKVFIEPSGWA